MIELKKVRAAARTGICLAILAIPTGFLFSQSPSINSSRLIFIQDGIVQTDILIPRQANPAMCLPFLSKIQASGMKVDKVIGVLPQECILPRKSATSDGWYFVN